ncbi:SH3 domain-containing protein [Candidatus Halobeggiatoa sp. HSG11]|nr:SH3 domain-containing protein [Candidatus Halobeggiatoa sp. HSG11]
MLYSKLFPIFLLTSLLISCSQPSLVKTNQAIEEDLYLQEEAEPYLDAFHIIQDIKTLAQNSKNYLNKSCAEQPLSKIQQRLDKRFNNKFFAPWQIRPSSKRKVTYAFRTYNNGFGETQQKRPKTWFNNLKKLANMRTYPNARRKAITIRNTNLRELPTNQPLFKNFNIAGEGYPFDNLQKSAIWANTPIFVSHISADKAWALVESPRVPGWIPTEDLAFVDKKFIKTWKSGKYVAITNDQTSIVDENNLFRFKANVGTIFPRVREDNNKYQILTAVTDENHQAKIRTAYISKQFAISKPLRLSQSNIAEVTNQLLNKPYGWGGMYENRDCSLTTRDLFTPFGLWLPRNSKAQAKTAGKYISLKNMSLKQKEKMIIKKGIPYLTLLWKKGHIMLYIGTFKGKALVFHNFWGIITKDHRGREDRKVVGKSAITTLRPGSELDNIDDKKGNFLRNIAGMTILAASNKVRGCR